MTKKFRDVPQGGCPQTDKRLPVECLACAWKGVVGQCGWPIEDVCQRIAAGETMSAGECPECGALADLIEDGEIEKPTVLLTRLLYPHATSSWPTREFVVVDSEILWELGETVKGVINLPPGTELKFPLGVIASALPSKDLSADLKRKLRSAFEKDTWVHIPADWLDGVAVPVDGDGRIVFLVDRPAHCSIFIEDGPLTSKAPRLDLLGDYSVFEEE